MKRGTTVYLYELAWILPSFAIPIGMPVGSTVHFWATSKDVVHGFLIPKHIVNVMLLPGQIAHAQVRFDEPGEFPIICHEYCGIAHHTMAGKVIVEPRR